MDMDYLYKGMTKRYLLFYVLQLAQILILGFAL